MRFGGYYALILTLVNDKIRNPILSPQGPLLDVQLQLRPLGGKTPLGDDPPRTGCLGSPGEDEVCRKPGQQASQGIREVLPGQEGRLLVRAREGGRKGLHQEG